MPFVFYIHKVVSLAHREKTISYKHLYKLPDSLTYEKLQEKVKEIMDQLPKDEKKVDVKKLLWDVARPWHVRTAVAAAVKSLGIITFPLVVKGMGYWWTDHLNDIDNRRWPGWAWGTGMILSLLCAVLPYPLGMTYWAHTSSSLSGAYTGMLYNKILTINLQLNVKNL